jgi:hypothetical protein
MWKEKANENSITRTRKEKEEAETGLVEAKTIEKEEFYVI